MVPRGGKEEEREGGEDTAPCHWPSWRGEAVDLQVGDILPAPQVQPSIPVPDSKLCEWLLIR